MEENVIIRLSFEFAVKIIHYSELLEENKKYSIARQVLRSGTSIGANVKEAQSAESKTDFIHKMKIADKEAHETMYWLMLCNEIPSYPKDKSLLSELETIMKVLNKIIATSKRKSISTLSN